MRSIDQYKPVASTGLETEGSLVIAWKRRIALDQMHEMIPSDFSGSVSPAVRCALSSPRQGRRRTIPSAARGLSRLIVMRATARIMFFETRDVRLGPIGLAGKCVAIGRLSSTSKVRWNRAEIFGCPHAQRSAGFEKAVDATRSSRCSRSYHRLNSAHGGSMSIDVSSIPFPASGIFDSPLCGNFRGQIRDRFHHRILTPASYSECRRLDERISEAAHCAKRMRCRRRHSRS